jgi:hypothetical protein
MPVAQLEVCRAFCNFLRWLLIYCS